MHLAINDSESNTFLKAIGCWVSIYRAKFIQKKSA